MLWKTPIPGRGHSSPVVWGKRLFLTTAVEGAVTKPGFTALHAATAQDIGAWTVAQLRASLAGRK